MKKQKIVFFVSLICVGFLSLNTPRSISAPDKQVYVITLDDVTINPVTSGYISNAIDKASQEKAECLIIKLDTPGGLLSSTRTIVKKILASDVPVVVYIAPSGSRAGSAGVFITYSSHIAAMAPSTNIGAAHPVQMGGKKGKKNQWEELQKLLKKSLQKDPSDQTTKERTRKQNFSHKDQKPPAEPEEKIQPDDDPMSSKILQDTLAFIRSLALKRNRNAQWAIKSVAESASITETEASELAVVEIIADDVNDLLKQIDGRVVDINGTSVVLNTKDANVQKIEMDIRERFLNVLANPNIAYILMILGFYGLLYEITHPGIGVPGIAGTIFLILAFYSMQTLPTNYAGLGLIGLSIILFIAEANAPGLGLLALGGLVSMVLGSVILFDSSMPMMRVSNSLIFAVSFTTAAITIFLVRAVLLARRRKALGGQGGLVGEKGEVKNVLKPGKEGKVFVHGELWNAVSDKEIKVGERIKVTEVNGLTLKVKKLSQGGK